jgi:hypothetical protein
VPMSSEGSARMAMGARERISSSIDSDTTFIVASVCTAPGAIALTVMPCGPSSRANPWVSPISASFEHP